MLKSMNHPSPIAVVGMAGIFPGASNTHRFWKNIVNRIDAVADVPPQRWATTCEDALCPEPFPDCAISSRACLIADDILAEADAALDGLHLDHDFLLSLDPLYRLILAVGRQAMDTCRWDGLKRERIGVVLAAIALPTDAASRMAWDILGTDFKRRLFGEATVAVPVITRQQAMAARVTGLPGALLAKGLGIEGGSYTLDAACASSLYAVKLACDQLRSGRADLMLAGGASRPDSLYTQIGFSQLRALSPSGRCAPFDKSADGLVVGEGVGMVMLKRLEDAVAAGDEIQAVIRGIGLSNDMDGNLLAPDPEGQVRAMTQAYAQAGWFPADVDLIECHGAGTAAGDMAEISSLCRLWGESGWSIGQCPIGSVKSMVGHLLTGAGAAGLIKTLLAMKQRTLPPTLNFTEPPENSPLRDSPFRLQSDAADWPARNENIPRRAAVSAFGFGGINAHLLLEEWTPGTLQGNGARANGGAAVPVAVVGMSAAFGPLDGLKAFETAVVQGRSVMGPRPTGRFRGADKTADAYLDGRASWGGFMAGLTFALSDVHIPPKEIQDILPQHLLMLKVARQAMEDAGLALREKRPLMGAVIGMGFDYEATNFHLRWHLKQVVASWAQDLGIELNSDGQAEWLQALRSAWGPPLTPTRTLGALGGIIANRIGRELQFGGPTFVVSDEAASGIRALEIGVRSLQQGETDAFLVGAVDLAADIRAVVIADVSSPFSGKRGIRPFGGDADGTLPGDGAGAMVLKRLEDARADGDRIYSVIRGIGAAGCGGDLEAAYSRSLGQACREAGVAAGDLGYIEVHGSGIPAEDGAESGALELMAAERPPGDRRPWLIGETKSMVGHAGAASGMASLVKTALCFYHGRVPPFSGPQPPVLGGEMGFPEDSVSWPVSNNGQPRPAAVAAMTPEGNCTHVILAPGDKGPTAKRQPTLPLPVSGDSPVETGLEKETSRVYLELGGAAPQPVRPWAKSKTDMRSRVTSEVPAEIRPEPEVFVPETGSPASSPKTFGAQHPYTEAIRSMRRNVDATVAAHQQFLALSDELTREVARTVERQARLLAARKTAGGTPAATTFAGPEIGQSRAVPAFSRDLCMEFAVGSVEKVLGPAFAPVDTFKARVRLPDEPLMLVDRILSVQGRKGGLGPGRLVTEHDVLSGAWYLDGERAPVCISVEAGQADLFLCAYLGIDFKIQGLRTYRLLDATVRFHRGLPRPGDVIRYDIEIDKFVRQGDTWLFFFRFEGTIAGAPFISMSDGCAGFFTPEEVEASGGILLTEEETRPVPGKRPVDWIDPIPMAVESYDAADVDALRQGDASGCFGQEFDGVRLPDSLRLPGGRLKLIDRVLSLDPTGGRYGIGSIRAEADIHPDDWFLTCHFVDDMVMPGTLMYECCAHTLRIFMLRTGWVTDRPGVAYEPVTGVKSVLKCRGPVTPATRHVIYQVEIKEIGYGPEPYALADAHMFADGHRIVFFHDMSMKLTGLSRKEIDRFWQRRRAADTVTAAAPKMPDQPPLFDRHDLVEFAVGSPSKAFGPEYRPFDRDRFIARLPGPPFLMISRIVAAEPAPWVLKPGGWIEAEIDLTPNDWYFRADRSGSLPIGLLLEAALQPCGWLAAYAGSALKSQQDLKFRNLGGTAVLNREITAEEKTLTVRARMTQASEAADMILESFEFRVQTDDEILYQGTTHFGFFTLQALEQQVGIRDADKTIYQPQDADAGPTRSYTFFDEPPLFPDDSDGADAASASRGLRMPAKALRMIDAIDLYLPKGGPDGLGFIRGTKTVDPQEWFFRAHFFQDPVCPGSLGIESFIQLIKFAARQRWPGCVDTHRFALSTGSAHTWLYRGQIVPDNRTITVEAVVTRVEEAPAPFIQADGCLKVDGRTIYKMEKFGLRLVLLTS